MGKIIAIVNQKGGVGKTTTAINLATALAAVGKKTLLIDNDPQGNTSSGFGLTKENVDHNLYTMLISKSQPEQVITKTKISDLDIILGDIALAGVEAELLHTENCRFLLKNKLSALQDQYDYIFIDCPPSLGLLTVNALVAASSILVPLQCEFFALEGLKHLIEIFQLVKQNLNKDLVIHGIILTMYDRRNNLTELVEQDVRKCLGDLVYSTIIPRNVRLSEASSHGKPALIYDMHCTGSVAHIELATEFLNRESAVHKGAACR